MNASDNKDKYYYFKYSTRVIKIKRIEKRFKAKYLLTHLLILMARRIKKVENKYQL
jgi:hypothetical protein